MSFDDNEYFQRNKEDNTILVKYIGGDESILIPQDISVIGEKSFAHNRKIKNVIIPRNVTRIDYAAFYDCPALESVTMFDNGKLVEIDNVAFKDCVNLKRVALAKGLEIIGEFAFENCIGLDNITIPDTVTTISKRSFHGCTGLVSVKAPEAMLLDRGLFPANWAAISDEERAEREGKIQAEADKKKAEEDKKKKEEEDAAAKKKQEEEDAKKAGFRSEGKCQHCGSDFGWTFMWKFPLIHLICSNPECGKEKDY